MFEKGINNYGSCCNGQRDLISHITVTPALYTGRSHGCSKERSPVSSHLSHLTLPFLSMKRTLSQLTVEDEPSPSFLDFLSNRFASRRHRSVFTVGSILSILSLLVLAYFSFLRPPLLLHEDVIIQPDHSLSWNRKSPLLGPPTSRFRGNLFFSLITPRLSSPRQSPQ